MTALKSLRSTLLLTAAFALTAPSLEAQPLPSAADVIAKHVAAIGGKDAISQIKSMKQSATMEIPAVGMSADIELIMVAPNKMATKMNFPQIGEMLQGTDGTVAWSVNPMQGPRLLEGKELAQTKNQADFAATMMYSADRFLSMVNEGIVDFGGEKAYKIKLVPKEMPDMQSWGYFSVATGLSIGAEANVVTEMGTIQSTTLTKDYKQFGPLKVATRAETTAGPQTMIMTIKSVEYNTAGPDAVQVPAAVQPLIKK